MVSHTQTTQIPEGKGTRTIVDTFSSNGSNPEHQDRLKKIRELTGKSATREEAIRNTQDILLAVGADESDLASAALEQLEKSHGKFAKKTALERTVAEAAQDVVTAKAVSLVLMDGIREPGEAQMAVSSLLKLMPPEMEAAKSDILADVRAKLGGAAANACEAHCHSGGRDPGVKRPY